MEKRHKTIRTDFTVRGFESANVHIVIWFVMSVSLVRGLSSFGASSCVSDIYRNCAGRHATNALAFNILRLDLLFLLHLSVV